jgi:hypothetical protein
MRDTTGHLPSSSYIIKCMMVSGGKIHDALDVYDPKGGGGGGGVISLASLPDGAAPPP